MDVPYWRECHARGLICPVQVPQQRLLELLVYRVFRHHRRVRRLKRTPLVLATLVFCVCCGGFVVGVDGRLGPQGIKVLRDV